MDTCTREIFDATVRTCENGDFRVLVHGDNFNYWSHCGKLIFTRHDGKRKVFYYKNREEAVEHVVFMTFLNEGDLDHDKVYAYAA